MSEEPAAPSTYRSEAAYPFCPGCGHGPILDALDRALVTLRRDPRRTVIVSDIGCSGLSDQYFRTHAFHGLHGRCLTYATGIKLARPDLSVVAVMGDGGCGIGGQHLLGAARRNVGLTVVVFNNFNFGMTGGQHSATTPTGAVTATTLAGNLERPLDIAATVAANGASFVWRGTSFDKDLSERMAEAMETDGFALLDVWELCTAYFVPHNRFSRSELMATLERLRLPTGVIHREQRPEYARACREAVPPPSPPARWLTPRFRSPLAGTLGLVLAGSAGGKVRSAARLAGEAAILCGLRASQRDDYPVTVKTGYSVSELVLGPEPVAYTGIARPDVMVVASTEGMARVGRALSAMDEDDVVFVASGLPPLSTRATQVVIDVSGVTRAERALVLLAAALTRLEVVPPEALRAAAAGSGHEEETVRAVERGASL